jgi:hypothetical protein
MEDEPALVAILGRARAGTPPWPLPVRETYDEDGTRGTARKPTGSDLAPPRRRGRPGSRRAGCRSATPPTLPRSRRRATTATTDPVGPVDDGHPGPQSPVPICRWCPATCPTWPASPVPSSPASHRRARGGRPRRSPRRGHRRDSRLWPPLPVDSGSMDAESSSPAGADASHSSTMQHRRHGGRRCRRSRGERDTAAASGTRRGEGRVRCDVWVSWRRR